MRTPVPADLVATLCGGRRIISVVGAGGKKTSMYALAGAVSGRVALTSTAHMYLYDQALVDVVELVEPHHDVLPRFPDARVVGYGGLALDTPRVAGLTAAQVAALAADPDFALVVIKADGAKGRWVKAPADYEPIVPPCTERVLCFASAQVIGRPLDDTIAHRPALIAAATGAAPGAPLTVEHIGRLLASPLGSMKGLDAHEVLPVLNMVDDAVVERAARAAAHLALELTTRFDTVVLASLRHGRIVDVVTRGSAGGARVSA